MLQVVPMTDQQSMQDPTVAPGELDDDDGGGLVSLSSFSLTFSLSRYPSLRLHFTVFCFLFVSNFVLA